MSDKTCQTCQWLIHTRHNYFGVNVETIEAFNCNYEPKQQPVALDRPACSKWEEKKEEIKDII